mgnify:CR=1 FL=1
MKRYLENSDLGKKISITFKSDETPNDISPINEMLEKIEDIASEYNVSIKEVATINSLGDFLQQF